VVDSAELPPAWRAGFEALQQRFCAGLPQRWHDIAQPHDPALRHRALHQLAGAAGSYGFARLSHLAREAEQSLLNRTEPAWQPSGSALEAEIASLCPSQPPSPAPFDTV